MFPSKTQVLPEVLRIENELWTLNSSAVITIFYLRTLHLHLIPIILRDFIIILIAIFNIYYVPSIVLWFSYHILHLVHLQLMYSNPGHWDFITMRAYLWELKLFAIGFAWLMQSQLSFPSAFPCPFVASTCPENSFLWPWQCQYCRPVQEISCGRIFWSSVSCSNAILLSQIFLWVEWTLSWNLFICIRISSGVLQLSGFSE